MKRWYAIHTFSGQENNIKKHIEQMIEREGVQDKFGQIIVPTREVVSNVRGKRRTSVQNLFPAYIIIEMELDELTQHLVSTINGVTHFAGMTRASRVPIPFRFNRARSIAFLESILKILLEARSKSRTKLAKMSASRKVLSRALWAS